MATEGGGIYVAVFLSTPSARRATNTLDVAVGTHAISIHALREEGDTAMLSATPAQTKFLSTPSARRATQLAEPASPGMEISIHALREEGDCCPHPDAQVQGNFYPRPPRGGRPAAIAARRPLSNDFYPRPPRGGRQQKQRQNLYFQTNYTTFCTNLEEP